MTLTDTNDRRIGYTLLLLAVLVLGWVIYDLWQRVMNLAPQNTVTYQTNSPQINDIQNPYTVAEIVDSHLFGIKQQEVAVKKVEPPKEVEKTRLRLKLLGLVASDVDDMSRALISAENGRLNSYAIGEQIENTDSTVHTIEATRVLLDRDGRLESLEMVRPPTLAANDRRGIAGGPVEDSPIGLPEPGPDNSGGFEQPGFDQPLDEPGLATFDPNNQFPDDQFNELEQLDQLELEQLEQLELEQFELEQYNQEMNDGQGFSEPGYAEDNLLDNGYQDQAYDEAIYDENGVQIFDENLDHGQPGYEQYEDRALNDTGENLSPETQSRRLRRLPVPAGVEMPDPNDYPQAVDGTESDQEPQVKFAF